MAYTPDCQFGWEASEAAHDTRGHLQKEYVLTLQLTVITRLPIHVWVFHYSLLYLF